MVLILSYLILTHESNLKVLKSSIQYPYHYV